jgi:hypothetical protein
MRMAKDDDALGSGGQKGPRLDGDPILGDEKELFFARQMRFRRQLRTLGRRGQISRRGHDRALA